MKRINIIFFALVVTTLYGCGTRVVKNPPIITKEEARSLLVVKEETNKDYIGARVAHSSLTLMRKIATLENMYSGELGFESKINYADHETDKYEYSATIYNGLFYNGIGANIYDLFHEEGLSINPFSNMTNYEPINVTNIENRLFDHYKYIDGHSK